MSISWRARGTAALCAAGLMVSLALAANPAGVVPGPTCEKLHPALVSRLAAEPGPAKAWVFFRDKGFTTRDAIDAALAEVERTYNPRALQRRALRADTTRATGELVHEIDLPVAPAYIDAVLATGVALDNTSRWLNAVTVYATDAQARAIADLPFVDRLEPVARSWKKTEALNASDTPPPAPQPVGDDDTRVINYGVAQAQLTEINLVALHNAGYTGQGVIIGILDTGFRRDHQAFTNPAKPVQVIAEYDFVMNDTNTGPQPGDPSTQHNHGTYILGCIGAYLPNTVVGGAFDASFVLAKTEDTSQEVPAEEDDYVAGLEFIESYGADMSTASLGYIDWYTQAQLNGTTAVTTIAMNIHTSLGVHHTNAAGNESHDSNPATSHLIAPADAFKCITVGAVTSSNAMASFSSDGPTADGRVKPEILARGVSTYTVSPSSTTATTAVDGTSLSTPLAAAALACIIQAKPWWTVDQMRQRVFETSDYFVQNGTYDPTFVRGYGRMNAFAAFDTCDDAGQITLDRAVYNCGGSAVLGVNDCDLNADPNAIESVQVTIASTSAPGGLVLTLIESAPDAAYFEGSVTLVTSATPGSLLVASGDTITATYIDADNGQGGFNVVVTDTAAVDCQAPAISGVTISNVTARGATISFNTDESVKARIRYGTSCALLDGVVEAPNFSSTPSLALNNLSVQTRFYLQVEAVDAAGNVGVSNNGGSCYTFVTLNTPPVLLVDDDDNGPDMRAPYVAALNALGIAYDVYDTVNSDNEPTAAYLEPYCTVIWFTGDEFGGACGPGAAGETALTTWLATGKNFLISSQDYFFDRDISGQPNPFMLNVLGVQSVGNDVSPKQTTVTGVNVFAGLGPYTLSFGSMSNWTDNIVPNTTLGASLAFSGNNGGAGISRDSGTYKTIFVVVPLETLPAAGLQAVLDRAFDWFTPCAPPLCAGDLNCDGGIDFADIDAFVEALSYPAGAGWPHACDWLNGDCNADSDVTFADIDAFVGLIGTTCP